MLLFSVSSFATSSSEETDLKKYNFILINRAGPVAKSQLRTLYLKYDPWWTDYSGFVQSYLDVIKNL